MTTNASHRRSTAGSRAERARRTALTLLALAAPPAVLGAQAVPRAVLPAWLDAPATPGYERIVTEAVVGLAGWTRDAFGNAVKTVGTGTPRRLIACAADQPGYVVSQIRDDGWLRVQTAGTGRRHPLWDQFHEGQRAVVITGVAGGAMRKVPGVFGVRSTHLQRGRPRQDAPATIDDLWVDVGARSAAEVARLGIRILDPVARDWPAWRYGDWVAGPDAAGRAGCAAVAGAAESPAPTRGTTTYVLAAQGSFAQAGLASVLGRLGAVDTLLLLTGDALRVPRRDSTSDVMHAVTVPSVGGARVTVAIAPSLPVRYRGTLVESVRDEDVDWLMSIVRNAAAVPALRESYLVPAPLPRAPQPRGDSLARGADLLATLSNVYAVSGHEQPMRDAILAAMPAWARAGATTDSAGNLVLAMGPERDTIAFVAHMDEIGFEITKIAPNGTVSLRPRGGMFQSMWEGQPALLHRAADRQTPRTGASTCTTEGTTALHGIFVPRDSAPAKQPAELTAWFGVDSATLVAAGAKVGDAVTAYKCATRLGDVRFTARALDDRAGSTALVAALGGIDPAALRRKVIFAWSTREETGLEGARALAAQWRGTVKRVYAVDTFVSSDSPIESTRFADLPLGAGAVVRALDNSSATPPHEAARVVAAARAARIPVQVGTTNGGNDGSAMLPYGVIDIPLSWPGRYSHSPAEVLDLRDLRALSRLIEALATGP